MKIEERMGHMEDMIEIIVKLLQLQEEKIPIEDEVGQGTHEDKNSPHVELPSMNKNDLRGFDSNIGSNQGWSARGLQLPEIDMRKFYGKAPWILQMEQFFDIHQVSNLQKVTIASLYLEPQQFMWYQ